MGEAAKNTGQFQKGWKGGPGRGKKTHQAAGSDVFEDFVLAYTTPSSPLDTPGVKAARKLLETSHEKFIAAYVKLKPPPVTAAVSNDRQNDGGSVGEKEEKVSDLIESLLGEFHGRHAGHGVAAGGEAEGEADVPGVRA